MNGDKRYHGEIQVTIGGNAARITVFSDNLQELFADLGTVHAQFGRADAITNPAKREIVNAELKARQAAARAQAGKAAAADDLFADQETSGAPTCPECGSSEFMELITFPDKKTGEYKKRWKCQQCQKWYWPNGKGQ